jgi:hypothetical protein
MSVTGIIVETEEENIDAHAKATYLSLWGSLQAQSLASSREGESGRQHHIYVSTDVNNKGGGQH